MRRVVSRRVDPLIAFSSRTNIKKYFKMMSSARPHIIETTLVGSMQLKSSKNL